MDQEVPVVTKGLLCFTHTDVHTHTHSHTSTCICTHFGTPLVKMQNHSKKLPLVLPNDAFPIFSNLSFTTLK